MEGAQAAPRGGRAGAAMPMEPLENPVQPQAPVEERRLGSPESSPAAAAQEAPGPDPDPSGGQKLPSPRPARLRLLPAGLGYGAFRRPLSAAPEPPSPGPAAAEQPRDGEAAGTELVPRAAPEEPGPGSWAPVELQVDVLVKPVGAAGGSHAPSPAPSRRFITVPVPEPPASPRHAAPAGPLLPRTASLGSAWSRGSPLAAPRAEHGLAAEEGAAAPGAPACRCRCQEPGREDAAMLQRTEPDGDLKLHRAIRLIGARCRPCPRGWLWSGEHCYYLSTEAQAWEASQAFCSAHRATLPLLTHTQAPGGRQGPAGSEVRRPGGRQARGFGLRLFKTLGLCPGDQVTGILPVPTLWGHTVAPRGGGCSLDLGSCCSLLGAWGPCLSEDHSGEGFLWPIFHLRLHLLKRTCSETLRFFVVVAFEPWSLPYENGHYPFSPLPANHNVPFSLGAARVSDHR
ncbi:killer cell lectin-like receptor subfamily G member 2 isoform X2 [Pipistrellus kuhlii]|uniref:killer cell lectin-like receptor subfamily G member 2 isoform X2 n=1 Tax=Pipistrellus kuhlii TaxID=59472 RepID=UPI001E270EB1|nr:killer cell lectin-like receptor subfamily G member 2 isoform X2 [Pipistrellus kuhlii]